MSSTPLNFPFYKMLQTYNVIDSTEFSLLQSLGPTCEQIIFFILRGLCPQTPAPAASFFRPAGGLTYMGLCPKPRQGLCPLDPARGIFPLNPLCSGAAAPRPRFFIFPLISRPAALLFIFLLLFIQPIFFNNFNF